MAGTVPVSGQDGDAAALNRIALGTQTVDVWKDARMLGDGAGQIAAELAKGTTLDKITTDKYGNSAIFKSPGGNSLNSILLTPQAITKDNLQIVLDAGWIDKATLCKDVAAGAVKGC
jgi:D-xylose transport system substrate-binding protein